ncbi:SDR family NAD(P)-dependent oxidoreductase [Leptospira wolffii]|uniref:SDR family NAD(P)-dependent oxidoreductase n=1 Tax=Leptospira wolffii TaxID=409998 RepID=UPI0002F08C7D|nr:glucose 1-dehydrogenase [Leptospira wolffii]EPG65519.1 KR domain protein [Leptospira wolffii serovar Khorat str. Khorat-H2]
MSQLKGKVAVVTGASKGIGAGIARSFGAAGASVVVNYSSSKEGADKVVQEIAREGGKAIAVQGDMSKSSDVKRLFEETKKVFGSVNILVNNAGVFQFAPLEEVTEEEFHREMNTNVLGPILATRESLKYFPPEGGSVINIGSIISDIPTPNGSVYASTKGALDSLSQVLALELSPRKIRVNTIAPGPVDTEGAQSLGIIGSDFEKLMISKTPLGRIGRPDDVAKVALFLASEESAWLTGEKISVSGGYR